MRPALLPVALWFFACTPTTYDHGVPNFYQVGPGVWRSGQPTTAEGWAYIKAQHIRHVIKLNFETEGPDDGARAAGLDVHVLSIQPEGDKDIVDNLQNTFVTPDLARIAEAERLLETATPDDAWDLHCTHGMDRTGLAIGIYRVLHAHWSKDDAYSEMLKYHFHPNLHGLHETWENFQGTLPLQETETKRAAPR